MTPSQPFVEIMRLVNGYRVSQAIHVAAVLGIADLLKDGPRTSDDLAAETKTHPRSLYRLLRALAAVGVFREEPARRFAGTPLSDCLRSDAPAPAAPWAEFVGQQPVWQAWGHLLHSVRTGANAFAHVHGVDVWTYRSQHPQDGAIFDRAMTGISRAVGEAVATAYDFGRFACIIDVGGGQGAFLAQVLAVHRAPRGVVFDQPHVVAGAPAMLEAAGIADRCTVRAGSFFEAVPEGGDAHVLKGILHDWEDAAAVAILRACRTAIRPGGKVLLIERLIAPPNEAAEAKFSDLNMLVSPGGQERTREEFAALFAAAGLRLAAIVATGTALNVIEGVPV